MPMPTYTRQDGKISAYELACGCCEVEVRDGIRTTLFAEGGVYHVRQHDHNTHQRISWETFDRLLDARRRYDGATRIAYSIGWR